MPPGGQASLFWVASEQVPTFVVIDRQGREQVRTASLGVALTVARRVLAEQDEVWIRASDDTCVHIDPQRAATDTPSCPWIKTLAASLGGTIQ